MRRFIVTFALVSLLGSACGSTDQPNPAGGAPSAPEARASETGSKGSASPAASDFTLTTFAGETFSLAEQRGTPVVLNFWESW